MKEEQWLQKIKERLDSYSEPLPPAGWERLENTLLTSKNSIGRRKIVAFRRWSMAVAAVLLVAVFSVGVWLLNNPFKEDMEHANAIALAAMVNEDFQHVAPVVGIPIATSLRHNSLSHLNRRNCVAGLQQLPVSEESRNQMEEVVATGEPENKDMTSEQTRVADEKTKVEESNQRPVQKQKSLAFSDVSDRMLAQNRSGQKWSMAVSVANIGGLGSMMNSNQTSALYQDVSTSGMNYSSFDLLQASNSVLEIPDGQELVFKDGMPYLQSRSRQIASVHHKQPISFGLSVRKNLPKNFSVETGLTYTYLASEIVFTDGSQQFDQKLHYIGIPLRANWNFVNKTSFIVYLSGGGMIEKCIYGKVAGEKETVKPVQLSVMGAIGAQYNISRKVGVYVEPGVAYYFDDGSAVQTIRKENPCNFTLQAGLRLSY